MRVWLSGRLIEARSARIDLTDRGFTLEDGIFETIEVSANCARLVPLHLQRMRQGAMLLGIPLHDDDAGLTAALASLISANQLAEAVLRVTLSRGRALAEFDGRKLHCNVTRLDEIIEAPQNLL